MNYKAPNRNEMKQTKNLLGQRNHEQRSVENVLNESIQRWIEWIAKFSLLCQQRIELTKKKKNIKNTDAHTSKGEKNRQNWYRFGNWINYNGSSVNVLVYMLYVRQERCRRRCYTQQFRREKGSSNLYCCWI